MNPMGAMTSDLRIGSMTSGSAGAPVGEVASRAWRDVYFTSRDGLRLYGRHYPAAVLTGQRPLLCLPGLTRNSTDFHELAVALSGWGGRARDVWTIDYRGRGRSAHDPDPKNYSVHTEMLDVIDFMTVNGIAEPAVLGSSRGGLILMLLACYRPTAIGLAILNDIGPVLERDGLVRIVAYVGRVPLPATWPEAVALVRGMSERQFDSVPDRLWPTVARKFYLDDNGYPAPAYDRRLAEAISMLDGPFPTLWREFQALSRFPTLVLRGANSDLLSQRTVEEMLARHARLDAVTVPGEGHTPLLMDARTIDAIAKFVAGHDADSDVQGGH
jgi:pimeloyl-ACP methyl ester carboxylesterase